jgi:ClpP class serine protease
MDRRLFGDLKQPSAFGLFFDAPPEVSFSPDALLDGGIAVLPIRGPLEQHAGWWTNYEGIVAATEAAMQCAQTRVVVHKFDSPGGVCSGMTEARTALEALSARYGKPLLTYVDGMLCSAAFNLACASREIWMAVDATAGSIGVIYCTVDETEALTKAGVKVRYVTTGARKADGQAGVAVDDAVLADAQRKVDTLGALFFEAAASARHTTAEAIEGLQAAVFHGKEALAKGLADGVAGWAEFLALVGAAFGDTVAQVAAPAPKVGAARNPKDRNMATLLQAQQTATAAQVAVTVAAKALAAKPSSNTAQRAHDDALLAKAEADAALAKVTHHVKYEKKSIESDPPADSEEPSKEAAALSEEPAPSTAKSEDPKSGEDAKGTGAEKALDTSHSAYMKAAAGVDPYGVHSPKRMAEAIMKATGQKTLVEAMGALSAIPQRAAVEKSNAEKIAKLEAAAVADRVNALVAEAKKDGRAPSKAMRASLRDMGLKMGEGFLRGHLATLPKIVRTEADGALQAAADGKGSPAGLPSTDEQEEKMLASMFAGYAPEKRAEAIEMYRAERAKSATHKPSH